MYARYLKLFSLHLYVLPILVMSSVDAVAATPPDCPEGTLLEPYQNICATVNNQSNLDEPDAQTSSLTSPQTTMIPDGLPVPRPGSFSAGIEYKLGTLQVLTSTRFVTKMYVQTVGLEATSKVEFLFTVIGGRAQKGIEPVGIYTDAPNGGLGLFDWSCSPEFPCENGESGPSWVKITGFEELACQLKEIVDDGGHGQTILLASNDATRLSNESPPHWVNQFYLWNYCENEWDMVYEHSYQVDQVDCSLTYVNCARYANWIETHTTPETPLPPSEINELGFEDARVLHDGTWSKLNDENSSFYNNVDSWETFHLQEDRSYGVGNFTVTPTEKPIAIDILPGSKRNPINPRSKGKIRVAVLSDTNPESLFDPSSQLDTASVSFGPLRASVIHMHVKDLNRDGLGDLLLQFRLSETGISCEDSDASLIGLTYDGVSVKGTDTIRPVGCRRAPHDCRHRHHNRGCDSNNSSFGVQISQKMISSF